MATVSDAQLRQLKKFMDDSSLTCTEEWLAACVNWIQENYPVVNLEVLRRELRVQWRDTNLEEMESACLPPNLVGQKLAKLPGKYGLQINSVRDIGESSYSQWTKLKKLENDNTSVAATDSNEYKPTWQPTPKRCLYLKMTDGTQQVFGMEMQPIPGLSLNSKPGLKVVILGPVECRRGVFHLRPNNIRIEGGEVEDLFESNKMDKILADILKVPADNRPRTQTQTLSNRNPFQTPISSSNNAISGDFPDDDTQDQFPDMEVFGDDDDIFMEIDEEALISSATGGTGPSTNSSSTSTSSANLSSRPTTTSRIPRSANFTDEIEDFEDDPGFTSSTVSSSSSSTNSRLAATSGSGFSSNLTRPAPASKSTITTTTNTTKTKSTFMPPPAKPKAPAATSSVTVPAPTSLFSSKRGNAKNVIKPSSSSDSNSGSNSTLPGFSTAKSALTAAAGSSGSTGSGKQMKILTYMKPMPVIIDPPTPERRLKRRKKSVEEDVSTIKQERPPSSVPIKMEEESDMLAESEIEGTSAYENPPEIDDFGNDENDMNTNSPDLDDSLMRIVDEAVEKRLSERFEPDDDLAEPLQMANKPSASTSNRNNASRKLTYPVQVPEYPYFFIQEIQENLSELASKRKVVNVKACISTVVSNIKIENGSWNLEVRINDGTGYMNCTIRSTLLNDIIGFSPTEMKALKATKEGKQKIAETMNGLATRLVHLNAILSIEMGGEQPAITQITDLMLHHCTALKQMLSQIGL